MIGSGFVVQIQNHFLYPMKIINAISIAFLSFGASCGYKKLHWEEKVLPENFAVFDTMYCHQLTALPYRICPSNVQNILQGMSIDSSGYKGVFVFAGYCEALNTFMDAKSNFDSIPNFEYSILMDEDYMHIVKDVYKQKFSNLKLNGDYFITDENYYGTFIDQRVKIKQMLDDYGFSQDSIRVTLFGKTVAEAYPKFNPKYLYLSGGMYFIFDSNNKMISASYSASPADLSKYLADRSR